MDHNSETSSGSVDDSDSDSVDTVAVNASREESMLREIVTWWRVREIANGSSAIVYEAIDSGGFKFAVKQFRYEPGRDNYNRMMRKCFLKEVGILRKNNHKNIIDYYGNDEQEETNYIFLKLMNKGSLSSISNKEKIDEIRASFYVRETLQALCYLHNRNIVHRDVKGANILVGSGNLVKLADFGSAKEISDRDLPISMAGSYRWMAPEIVRRDPSYSLRVDIWSLGCTLIEILSGVAPYGKIREDEVMKLVNRGEKPPFPHNISEVTTSFIEACLSPDPAQRPTSMDLLQHPFLRYAE